jgi:iron(III) transport system permease protein
MLAASVLLYAIGKVLLGRGFDAATTKAGVNVAPTKLTGWKMIAAVGGILFVIGLAVLPHISVILVSISEPGAWYKSFLPSDVTLGHFGEALTDDLVYTGITNSLLFALLATLIACVVGVGVAIIVVRSRVPGRGLIDALAMLPLAVPGLVLAFGYLSVSIWLVRTFGDAAAVNTGKTGAGLWAEGFFGDGAGPLFWLNVQEYPAVLLVLAYAARRLPYVVRSAVAGLQQTPRDLELAASNLGASRWRVLGKITVPLIVANLIAGGLLAFAFAMLEVSDSLILAQRAEYYPITKAIFELYQGLGTGPYVAAALGVWAMAMLALTILAANSLMAKKMGAIFRI